MVVKVIAFVLIFYNAFIPDTNFLFYEIPKAKKGFRIQDIPQTIGHAYHDRSCADNDGV